MASAERAMHWVKESGRAEYLTCTDAEALEAFQTLCLSSQVKDTK